MKTSLPDFLIDQMTCGCDLPMCPMCDPDFYYDMSIEDDMLAEPPFQGVPDPPAPGLSSYDTPKKDPGNCQTFMVLQSYLVAPPLQKCMGVISLLKLSDPYDRIISYLLRKQTP